MTTLRDFLKRIGDSIRSRTGKTEVINAQDFADEITSIPSHDSNVYVTALLGGPYDKSNNPLIIPDDVKILRSISGTNIDVILPKYLERINPSALSYGTYSEIIIPQTCITILNEAFENSTINKLVFDGLDKTNTYSISGTAFKKVECEELYINATIEDIMESSFSFGWDSNHAPFYTNETDGYINNFYIKNNGEYVDIDILKIPAVLDNVPAYKFTGFQSKHIEVAEGITTLNNYCFANMKKLESVKLPNSLTTINDQVFASSNGLKEIVIPPNVTYMGSYLLSYPTVIMQPTTPPTIKSNTLLNIKKIYVPKGCRDAYISASYWSNHSSKIIEPNTITINVPSTLLNNENYQYSIDQGTTWKSFTATSFVENDISSIYFKNSLAETTVLIGNTSGGNEIGTIANAQLIHNTSEDEVIYLSIGV